ncbi:hypothetical protein Hbl1158_10995 [Halobaculum sp. CBA1158]|uniref:hypothetical protein n=1 Tax=Halobaculum sp. CBA1158 TaxID=2904243 RepID=UPI001F427A4B|nr:hypothetical protein [Halobaculum sp. CBA1158]UIO99057.1 hypothetical protein Hbl1158_10995 [Halobaculum sp. CBA1158]
MEERDSPYVFRDEPADPVGVVSDRTDDEVVIIDGEAMTYRTYRGDDLRGR